MKTTITFLSRSAGASLSSRRWRRSCRQRRFGRAHCWSAKSTTVQPSYRGQATAVSGFASGSSVAFVDSGSLFVSGGAQEASSLSARVAGVFSAAGLHTTTIGQANVAATEASTADISITSGGFFLAGSVIMADFVMSRATAICTATGPTVSAQTEVNGLIIDGQSIAA